MRFIRVQRSNHVVRTLGGCRECWEGCSLDRFWRELPRIHSRVLLSVHVFVILSYVERKLVFTYDFLITKRCGSGSRTKRLVG